MSAAAPSTGSRTETREEDILTDQKAIEQIIEEYESEARTRHLSGRLRWVVGGLAVLLSAYSLYFTIATIPLYLHRTIFLGASLALTFLYYPGLRRWRSSIHPLDWVFVLLSVVTLVYMATNWDQMVYGATNPRPPELLFGAITLFLVLEASRRTTGLILPGIAMVFVLYAWLPYVGVYLPDPWGHLGYSPNRILGHLYLTQEGLFGIPLDVAATLIIVFGIYGSILDVSGAGRFFISFALAMMGRQASKVGRAVFLASFLLGGPSGSGVATTVTVGSIAWPLMRKVGFDRESAGGMLAAGGIGAVISPPLLGAAAFIMADYLRLSYLDIITMAAVPTILYYLAVFLLAEIDARRMRSQEVDLDTPPMGRHLLRRSYHFTSLLTVVVLMTVGFTPGFAVFWSILAAVILSFIPAIAQALGSLMRGSGWPRKEGWGDALDDAMLPRNLFRALELGGLGILSVVATVGVAGIIVGIVSLTGLGLKLSGIIVGAAGGNLFFTLVLVALALWVLGLAVPISASYIIGAVTLVPAMTKLGVADFAAHMFIFYYAVLSEVTPPTALSPFAAAAITGGNPYKTTMLAWKYSAVTFVVPFMFALSPVGYGLLLRGTVPDVAVASLSAVVGVVALTSGLGGWLLHRAGWPIRTALIVAGLLLTYSGTVVLGGLGISVNSDAGGLLLFGAAICFQALVGRRRRQKARLIS